MNEDTGKIYSSKEKALADGSTENQLVFGSLKTLRKLRKRLRMVSKTKATKRLKNKKQQKQTRKRNR